MYTAMMAYVCVRVVSIVGQHGVATEFVGSAVPSLMPLSASCPPFLGQAGKYK